MSRQNGETVKIPTTLLIESSRLSVLLPELRKPELKPRLEIHVAAR